MAKNIVICCDGTGHEINSHLSNVLKLYRMACDDDRQSRYYDPGVGTLVKDRPWDKYIVNARKIFGLATGNGLDDNILDAYRYLIHTYEEGDNIFLFGFSRGAYTVRSLAGLIYQIGVLRPEQLNLAEYALTAYRRVPFQTNEELAWRFSRVTNARRTPIKFMGLWDTVSSIITPRQDTWLPLVSLQNLPHTAENPAIQVVRQAAAIDEKRRMFRLHRWKANQAFKPNPFTGESEAQDFKQVWFAGSHSDVGGGYSEKESALAKFPLSWMITEAIEHGLKIDKKLFERLVNGQERDGSTRVYAAPNFLGRLHDSMSLGWKLIEYLPKRTKWLQWSPRKSLLGCYLPMAEPRSMETGALVHYSVIMRLRQSGYEPENLMGGYKEVGRMPPTSVLLKSTKVRAFEPAK